MSATTLTEIDVATKEENESRTNVVAGAERLLDFVRAFVAPKEVSAPGAPEKEPVPNVDISGKTAA